MILNSCKVRFIPETHQYFLGDKELLGVTGILSRRLFKDKYSAVPKETLERAAQRGSHIHKMCEMVDELGVSPDCEEAQNYIKLKSKFNLKPVAREYIVSDLSHYASMVDAIYEVDGGVVLNDLKTTYKLDKESISWQLSIYRYFFNIINPDIEVKGLTATWLRGDTSEYVDISPKTDEEVKKLLECDINNEDYILDNSTPEFIRTRLDSLMYLKNKIMKLQLDYEQLKTEIEQGMIEDKLDSVKTDNVTFTITKDSVRKSFDTKRFQEEHKDLYNKFLTEKTVKGSLTIRFK